MTNLTEWLSLRTKKLIAADVAGCTPIHKAAFRGNLEVIQLLFDYTNNPNVPNNQYKTPIDIAEQVNTVIEKTNNMVGMLMYVPS